jgi:hypothetical protein
MELKVIKYRNIGMISHDFVEDDYWNKHSYCSFELNNRNFIVCIFTANNFDNEHHCRQNEYYYINSLNDKFQNGFSNKSEKVSKEEIHLIEDLYNINSYFH